MLSETEGVLTTNLQTSINVIRNDLIGVMTIKMSATLIIIIIIIIIMWNQAVHTGREVTVNRPDIIIKNKKEKTCTLIDVAIPAHRIVVQ
jgi:hypothetical protein